MQMRHDKSHLFFVVEPNCWCWLWLNAVVDVDVCECVGGDEGGVLVGDEVDVDVDVDVELVGGTGVGVGDGDIQIWWKFSLGTTSKWYIS